MTMERLREPYQLLFLFMMKDGPVYGFELADHVQKASKGHFKVSYGAIYPFLRRMEKAGLIRARKDSTSGRVYYELTRNGRLAVRDLSDKLDEYQEEFEERMLGVLAISEEVFGQRYLNGLLNRIERELKGAKRR